MRVVIGLSDLVGDANILVYVGVLSEPRPFNGSAAVSKPEPPVEGPG